WTGRGKRPGWVEAALKAGKTLDELLTRDAQEAEA
ncbi:H-NS family nucleoid-associated regulatory protein, partial [Cupriavidus necator]